MNNVMILKTCNERNIPFCFSRIFNVDSDSFPVMEKFPLEDVKALRFEDDDDDAIEEIIFLYLLMKNNLNEK